MVYVICSASAFSSTSMKNISNLVMKELSFDAGTDLLRKQNTV